MTLRCKPGDLAFIVRSYCGNEGKIVRVVKLVGERLLEFQDGRIERFHDCWQVDPPMMSWNGRTADKIADCCLRPLRGDPSGKEVQDLYSLPKPQEVTA